MKEKDIIKETRLFLDNEMQKLGFRFNTKQCSYLKYDSNTDLYFEISLLFMKHPTSENINAKYLELFVNIYHSEISKLLLEVTTRGKNLNSFFSFKIVGNLLSDIVLNQDSCKYSSRNNHNYFKLIYINNGDIEEKSVVLLSLVNKYVIPFFDRLNNLQKIKNELDCCYDKGLSIHNVINERLFVVCALLFIFNDELKERKIEEIKNYFTLINYDEAILELDALIQKFR